MPRPGQGTAPRAQQSAPNSSEGSRFGFSCKLALERGIVAGDPALLLWAEGIDQAHKLVQRQWLVHLSFAGVLLGAQNKKSTAGDAHQIVRPGAARI